jgi:hypothetical protein
VLLKITSVAPCGALTVFVNAFPVTYVMGYILSPLAGAKAYVSSLRLNHTTQLLFLPFFFEAVFL